MLNVLNGGLLFVEEELDGLKLWYLFSRDLNMYKLYLIELVVFVDFVEEF